MSKTPFMQLWVSDFIGDTLHLSQAEIGQYLLLMMAMWNNGGNLPSDPKMLKRIVRGALSDAVMSFFEDDQQGGITQARLQKELQRTQKIQDSYRVRADKANASKSLKNNNAAHAQRSNSAHNSEPEPEETTNVVSRGAKRATTTKKRISPNFQPRDEDIKTLLSEGFSFSEIQDQLVRFRDYWTGTGKPMADWDATFRNWVRRSAEFVRGQSPPGQLRRDGMRQALDKLGGNYGSGLGSLSEFLALSGDSARGQGIVSASSNQGTSDSCGQVNPLSLSKGEQSN